MGHMEEMFLYYHRRRWHTHVGAAFGEPIASNILSMPIRAWVSAETADEAALEARARHTYVKRLKIIPGAAPMATRASGRLAAKVACGLCWSVSVVGNADGGSGVLEELASCDGFNEGTSGVWFCSDCQDLLEQHADVHHLSEGRALSWEEQQRLLALQEAMLPKKESDNADTIVH